eukprot:m.2688 g.2688  ORF g.2688 m.2688 type:complete len:66 (+) comp3821_c0_seq2:1420-1617(+)
MENQPNENPIASVPVVTIEEHRGTLVLLLNLRPQHEPQEVDGAPRIIGRGVILPDQQHSGFVRGT